MIEAHFDASDLIQLFDTCFRETHQTILVKGGDEPMYIPMGDARVRHQIVFAHGYFASALHEIAHWTIAGRERRKLLDYGYWYKPDGRTQQEQQAFEQVEVKPQALEWLFSEACGKDFVFSADNLESNLGSTMAFREKVHQQVHVYLAKGLPKRASLWRRTLADYYGRALSGPEAFSLAHLATVSA